jgi:hypothetical protein
MHTYDHAITLACFGAAVDVLDKHPNTLLEDIGTYLVTDPALEPLRRLLRFGGGTFAEFLVSLEELPDRARLAMPEVEAPEITLEVEGGGRFTDRRALAGAGDRAAAAGGAAGHGRRLRRAGLHGTGGDRKRNGTLRIRVHRCRFQRGQGVLAGQVVQ